MPRLNETVKAFIVTRLAWKATPSEVVEDVKEAFGLEVSRQQVHYYDPTTPASKTPKKWAELWASAHEQWRKEGPRAGVAFKNRRLELLDRFLQRVATAGNIPLALQILEQAAKEEGGAFTNHRIHSGPNGKAIPTSVAVTFVDADAGPEGAGGED